MLGTPTFLPYLGIVFPEDKTNTIVVSKENTYTLTKHTIRFLNFEKSEEIFTSHCIQFPKLLEIKDLADAVITKLMNIKSNPIKDTKQLRRFYKKYLKHLRKNLVINGYDFSFVGLGKFYALHNRQGQSENSWFAGSDIHLDADWQKLLNQSILGNFKSPILQSAFEISDYIFQDQIKTFDLDLKSAISNIGFDIADLDKYFPSKILVRTYHHQITTFQHEAVFVTDGARMVSFINKKPIGNEFVIKVPAHKLLTQSNIDIKKLAEEICTFPPNWIIDSIASGVLLSFLSKQGFAHEASVIDIAQGAKSIVKKVASFVFQKVGYMQLSEHIPFYFCSLVSLLPEEAELISKNKSNILKTYLTKKGYIQSMIPSRPSILNKTVVL